jgi:hypothetical protein
MAPQKNVFKKSMFFARFSNTKCGKYEKCHILCKKTPMGLKCRQNL